MKKRLTLHRETIRSLTPAPSLGRVHGGTGEDNEDFELLLVQTTGGLSYGTTVNDDPGPTLHVSC